MFLLNTSKFILNIPIHLSFSWGKPFASIIEFFQLMLCSSLQLIPYGTIFPFQRTKFIHSVIYSQIIEFYLYCTIINKYSMQSQILSQVPVQPVQNKEELALELFNRLGWSFTLTSIKDILVPQHMEEILLAVDYQYFFKVDFVEAKELSLIMPIIKHYMKKLLISKVNSKVEKELMAGNIKAWVSLILYLFGNCPMKQMFIQEIIECSPVAQEYFMTLMGEMEKNIELDEASDQNIALTQVDELQNQLNVKNQELAEIKSQFQKLKQENTSLKAENEKLVKSMSDYFNERADQLESVGVNNMEELLDYYKEALDINDRLNTQIEKFQNQNSQLQEMYSGISNDLIIAKHQNEEKESVLRTRVSTVRRRSVKGMRFATNSDSEEETSYKKSIDLHTKPLKEQIGNLDRYSRNLKFQMRLLYKEFTKLTTELRPFKEEGMFQDVLRSVF